MTRSLRAVPQEQNDQTTKRQRPGRWQARAAALPPAVAPSPPTFEPGLPYFEQLGPNTWIETAWARERCIRCPRLLEPGDDLYCPDHRYIREGIRP